jgi:hypothetical protein
MKIEIKDRFTNKVIYCCEAETIKEAIEQAVRTNANLENANLVNADLVNADLRNADLRNANLENADLRNAYLRNANLVNADLRNANLENANLRNADLRNADLRNANLVNANLVNAYLENADLRNADLRNANLENVNKLPIYCKWSHGITNGNLIHIGCEKRTIEEWDLFFNSDEKLSTERGTQEFKQIQAVFEAYKGYLNFLNK